MIAGVLAATARLIAGGTVLWTEAPTPQPHIYIANHSSHLDFILLWSVLPAEVRAQARPVAARDYWSGGLRRHLAEKVFHAILIDRGGGGPDALLPTAEQFPHDHSKPNSEAGRRGADAVEQMVAALEAGSSLILFPEGTRDQSGNMGRFRSGLYRVCQAQPNVPVVPVHMANLNRILPKGALLPAPLMSRIVMGPPFQITPGETRDEFLTRAREAVALLGAP